MIARDGAGGPRATALVIPAGVHLVPLPPASPERQPAERQPAERLWPLVDEVVANRPFAEVAELEAVLVTRCRTLRADRRRITAHTDYHWWPRERRPRRNQE